MLTIGRCESREWAGGSESACMAHVVQHIRAVQVVQKQMAGCQDMYSRHTSPSSMKSHRARVVVQKARPGRCAHAHDGQVELNRKCRRLGEDLPAPPVAAAAAGFPAAAIPPTAGAAFFVFFVGGTSAATGAARFAAATYKHARLRPMQV